MFATVDVVVPTRNRAELIEKKVSTLLADPHVSKVVVVADGCTDDTVERLNALEEERLIVVPLGTHQGPPAARNAGIERTQSEWILLTDDDDVLSDNFLEECLAVAELAQADVVGAPWIHLRPGEDVQDGLARTPQNGSGPEIDRPSIFPDSRWRLNLWFTTNMLISRSAALLYFDLSYKGNYYRDDSDFIVRAARMGFKPVVAGKAYSFTGAARAGGGIQRDSVLLRLRYEYWALRNTILFFSRHGEWIADHGFGRPGSLTAQFLAKRGRLVIGDRLQWRGRTA